MNKKKKQVIIAIDMGGTTGKIAIADLQGKIIRKFIIPTKYKDEVIPFYNQEIRKMCQKFNIDWKNVVAIGYGTTGNLGVTNSVVMNAGNVGWFNYPIRKVAEKYFEKPIFFINDSRAITYAEMKKGAGRNYKYFLTLSIGTGVGGGLVIDNKIVKGAKNLAGEYAHGGDFQNIYKCTCGLTNCMEALSSATGIEKYFQKYIKNNPNSSLSKRQKKIDHKITIKDVSDLIKIGDKDAIKAFSLPLKPLVDTISFLAIALDLEAVLIGGGPSAIGQPLIDIIKHLLKPIMWDYVYENLDVKLCELKNDAGIIGVILYTLDNLKNI